MASVPERAKPVRAHRHANPQHQTGAISIMNQPMTIKQGERWRLDQRRRRARLRLRALGRRSLAVDIRSTEAGGLRSAGCPMDKLSSLAGQSVRLTVNRSGFEDSMHIRRAHRTTPKVPSMAVKSRVTYTGLWRSQASTGKWRSVCHFA